MKRSPRASASLSRRQARSKVFRLFFDALEAPAAIDGGNARGATPHERIEDGSALWNPIRDDELAHVVLARARMLLCEPIHVRNGRCAIRNKPVPVGVCAPRKRAPRLRTGHPPHHDGLVGVLHGNRPHLHEILGCDQDAPRAREHSAKRGIHSCACQTKTGPPGTTRRSAASIMGQMNDG